MEEYFSDQPNDKDSNGERLLLDDKSKPFKNPQEDTSTISEQKKESKKESGLSGEEQILIENSGLSDEYILNRIVEAHKTKKVDKNPGRVFIFPTLQMNVINYREDEEIFLKLMDFYS